MSFSSIESLKIKAKLLQKAKKKKSGVTIQLKEAYQIIAKASGFNSWRELKEIFDATEHYCPKGSSAYYKTWFKDYDQALSLLAQAQNFLLPYRDYFFICHRDYINFLGVDTTDPDLQKVGRNWVEPLDSEAFFRISKKIRNRYSHSQD